MPHLLSYLRGSGLIQGVWSAAHPDHLRPNIEEGHPTLGYLLLDEPALDAHVLQERHWVRDGVLHACAKVTLVATPNPFVADGAAECVIRPQPFVPCTLLVGPLFAQTAVELTTEDDALILTAATPEVVPIQLAPLAGYWAPPIQVEAA